MQIQTKLLREDLQLVLAAGLEDLFVKPVESVTVEGIERDEMGILKSLSLNITLAGLVDSSEPENTIEP